MDLAEAEKEIRSAIDAYLASGKKLARGGFVINDCSCPLQCLRESREFRSSFELCDFLGWSRDKMWSFVSGFDGSSVNWFGSYELSKEHQDLGKRIFRDYESHIGIDTIGLNVST